VVPEEIADIKHEFPKKGLIFQAGRVYNGGQADFFLSAPAMTGFLTGS
jgi:hypothetical protein